jgi:O-antigen/teichoic acid export membrane protein
VTKTLFKNFLSLAGAEAFTKAITFIAFAYLARLFGASGFGHIEWAGAVLMCASLIVDQGFSSYGAREIAKCPAETPRLVAEIVTARSLFAGISYAAVLAFAFLFIDNAALRTLVLVYGVSLFILPALLQWAFQGHDRMNLVAAAQIIRQTVFVGVVFLFVRDERDLIVVGAAEVAAVACAAGFSLLMYRREFSAAESFRPCFSLKLVREGMPIGLSQMFWVIKMFGATFIVGLVATAADTGYFAGAMRIYIALHTFVWLYFANLLPSLARAWQQGGEQFSGLVKNSLRIVVPVSLTGGLIWTMLAPPVMKTAYGEEFLAGGGALQWLAGACVAAAVSGHYRFGLIAAGFQEREMWTSAVGALAAVVLIPVGYRQAGTGGAAAALCAAEIIVLLLSFFIARRKLFNFELRRARSDDFANFPEATSSR